MGIEPYLISSSIVAVMAQRLLRVICSDCKGPYKPREEILSLLSTNKNLSTTKSRFYKGHGCKNCLETGYLGRTGIFELLVIDDNIRELIVKRSACHIIKETAIKKDMSTLKEDGLRKALAGQTTLEEVYRVTQDSVQTSALVAKHVDG